MCKLAVFVSGPDGRNKDVRELIAYQYGDFLQEKDGMGMLAIVNGKVIRERSLKNYKDVFTKAMELYPTASLLALHSRTATVGAVSEENVHFFEHKGMYFAHNGYVHPSLIEHNQPKLPVRDDSVVLMDGVKKRWDRTSLTFKEVPPETITELDEKEQTRAALGEERTRITIDLDKKETSFLSCSDCMKLNMDFNYVFDYANDHKIGSCVKHRGLVKELKAMAKQIEELDDAEGIVVDSMDGAPISQGTWNPSTGTYSYAHTGKCDSFQFLETLVPRKLSTKYLHRKAEQSNFYGMGLLIAEHPSLSSFLIVKKPAYVMKLNDKAAAFFSYSPTVKVEEYSVEKVFGVPYRSEKTEVELVPGVESTTITEGFYKVELP